MKRNTKNKSNERQDKKKYDQILINIRNENFEEAKPMLKEMKDINYKKDGQTLLHHACCYPLAGELIKEIIALGADVNVKNKEGATPVFFSASLPSSNNLKILYEHRADIYSLAAENKATLLIQAIGTNASLDIIEFLIEKNCHLDTKCYEGMTPFLAAIEFITRPNYDIEASLHEKKMAIIHLLLNKKIDVNAKLKDGKSALFLATMKDDSELMELLIQHGADTNIRIQNDTLEEYS